PELRLQPETQLQDITQSLNVRAIKALGVEDHALGLVRFHGPVVHEPIRQATRRQPPMNQYRHTLFPAIVKLMSVKAKCLMTDRAEYPARRRRPIRCRTPSFTRRR